MSQETSDNGAVEAEAVVLMENGEPVAASVSIPSSDEETGGEIEGEAIVESEAVRIAETHAEATIAVAAIEADTETTRIEADLERERIWAERNERIAALEASMLERDRTITELEEQLLVAQASLSTPTPLAEAEEAAAMVAEAVDATLSEPNLTPEFTAENEPGTEPGPSVEEESAAVVAAVVVPARRRRRLI